MYKTNLHLDAMLVTPSGSDPVDYAEATRLKMSELGIESFIGQVYAQGGSNYTAVAVFGDSYTKGFFMRVAYAGGSIYKYRYNNGTWDTDTYVSDTATTEVTITPTETSTGGGSSQNKLTYWKGGNIVTLEFDICLFTANIQTKIATLPSGYRPKASITTSIPHWGNTTGNQYTIISYDGSVNVYATHTGRILFSVTYVAV